MRSTPRSGPLCSGAALALTAVLTAVALLTALAPTAGAGRARRALDTRAGEFQPVRGRRHLAWERNTAARPDHYDVFVQGRGKRKVRVNARGTMAANGGISGRRLVYQQWKGRRSDIRFFHLRKRKRMSPGKGVNTKQWEYWPSISGRWLLFGRRKAGIRRIILYDRRTHRSRTLAKTRGSGSFAAPGQVSGEWAVWSKCTPATGCNVFRYNIQRRRRIQVPNPGVYQRAPSVTRQGTVYFARAGRSCSSPVRIMRYFPGAQATRLVELPSGTTVNDTYAYSGAAWPTRLFFERNACRRPAVSGIWKLKDPRFQPLSVSKRASGGGLVTASPKGISCGGDCLHAFKAGTSVTLTADPEMNSNFTGWGGACSGHTTTCRVSMEGSRRVVAFFDPATSFSLSVTKDGNGKGRVWSRPAGIACGADCWQSFSAGTVVTLRVTPSAGSRFVRWRGACTGTGRCRVTIDRVRTVRALFERRAAPSVGLPCCLGARGATPPPP